MCTETSSNQLYLFYLNWKISRGGQIASPAGKRMYSLFLLALQAQNESFIVKDFEKKKILFILVLDHIQTSRQTRLEIQT